MAHDAVFETSLPGLVLIARGKVRDIYQLDQRLLIVATDRISAFDCVMPTPIADKGRILNSLSVFWFKKTAAIIANHLLSTDVESESCLEGVAGAITDRSMIVQRADVLPLEFIARGYLFGSAFEEYEATGAVCGIRLPRGLRLAEQLPEPILTPATKSSTGHDINISHEQAIAIVGESVFTDAKMRSLQLYALASSWLQPRGIILSDTKFEFGLVNGELTLVDEILTPDSARFWPSEHYRPGHNPPSFDKQFLRDYLIQIGWNREPPAPSLPDEIVRHTRDRYLEAFSRITGAIFDAPRSMGAWKVTNHEPSD